MTAFKQLLDEVFVTSRISNVTSRHKISKCLKMGFGKKLQESIGKLPEKKGKFTEIRVDYVSFGTTNMHHLPSTAQILTPCIWHDLAHSLQCGWYNSDWACPLYSSTTSIAVVQISKTINHTCMWIEIVICSD